MLRRIIFLFLFFILNAVLISSGQVQSSKEDQMVDDLLKQMTIEEKIGQMTQVTAEVVAKTKGDGKTPYQLDPEKLKEAVVDYKVGSILNVWDVALTVDQWHDMITNIQDLALNENRLKIPVIYGIDAIHGANYTLDATLFPQSIAMAATWDRNLVRKCAEITALEVRASGIPWNFNPVLGVGRNPLWPRLWETFGEDPYACSEFGYAYVKGIEGDNNNVSEKDKVAACMKHYLGYSFPTNGKDRTPALIPERMLRDVFLAPFKAAVEAGVHTVMLNSSEINGIPVHSDYYLVTTLLKEELGFKGFVVSDWEDIERLHTRDRVAETPAEAVKMAVMAGVDMSMVPFDYSFYELLLDLVNKGEVPESRIDDAVRRILWVKAKLDLFEKPYPDKSLKKHFATEESMNTNLDAARQVITLLKNESKTLPLKKETKVLITGPGANLLSVMNGGWTITWQGDQEHLYPQEKMTILEAIQDKVGKENVSYALGATFDTPADINFAVEQAKKSDVVIACIGEPTYCETPGNIDNLMLEKGQIDLVQKMYQTKKPVVLVLVQGRPRVIEPIVKDAEAIVMAYLPGMEGGRAIADVLFGDFNPSGKLPFTYPKAPNGFTTYDYKPLEQFDENYYEPQWPFGFGLSYTKFAYNNLKVNNQYSGNGLIEVSVNVTNSGDVSGKEAVHLFVTDLYGTVSRPVRQLKGFTKIELKPGESKEVKFKLTKDDLSFTNRENKKVVELGEFIISIADLQESFIVN